jgi:phage-related protein
MPDLGYDGIVNGTSKRIVWLHGEIKSPPFTPESRREIGRLIRRVQQGESVGMPLSRPMPSIGPRCHELRVRDEEHNWRLIYRIDTDEILVLDVFAKTTARTPRHVIDACKSRIKIRDNR